MSCREKNIHFNAGYNGCGDSIEILKNEIVPRDLTNLEEMTNDDVDINSYIYVDHDGEASKIKLGRVIANDMVQSDWEQDDPTKFDFIKNKPELTLQEDIVALYNIGGIRAGRKFEKGTSILEMIKEAISVDTPEIIYAGAIDSLAPIVEEDMERINTSSAELVNNGLVRENVDLQNQYYAIAIPKNAGVEVTGVYQEGYSLSFRVIDLNEAWDLVVDDNDVRATGVLSFKYKFKLK